MIFSQDRDSHSKTVPVSNHQLLMTTPSETVLISAVLSLSQMLSTFHCTVLDKNPAISSIAEWRVAKCPRLFTVQYLTKIQRFRALPSGE